MTLSHILMALAGAALGTAMCGLLKTHPDKRSIVVLLLLAVFGAAAAGVSIGLKPDCAHPQHVQAVWLDGAWQCISAEEAG